MSSFIITEKGLTKNAKKLMEDFYDYIHDEYMISNFSVFQKQRKYYDDNVVDEYQRILDRSDFKMYKDEESGGVCKCLSNSMFHIGNLVELTKDEIKNEIKNEIKSKTIKNEFVFEFLKSMDKKLKLDKSIEFECNEDLFCLKKAFLKAYDLFHYSGYNLD